jgi:signal peptidase I
MNQSSETRDRKPLLALAAALLMPGLGQVYNGELSRGLSFFLALAFLLPIAAWIGLHGPESMLWLVILGAAFAALALYVLAIRDAYLSAKRAGDGYELKPYNRVHVYLAMFFFGYFFVLGKLADYTKETLLESYVIPTSSMAPTLLRGDRFFVDKRFNRPGAKESVKRGDIAVFINPNSRNNMYVKRVIGLPGDRIEIRDMVISVNGKALPTTPLSSLGTPEQDRILADHLALRETSDAGSYVVIWRKGAVREPYSTTVPNGEVFMIGDDRDGSQDSRVVGPVPLRDVVAKAKQVWFSVDPEDGVRWSRLGRVLDGKS